MEQIIEQALSYGPLVINAFKALIVLILGWIVAGMVARLVSNKVNANENIDNTIGNFAASLVKWVIRLMVIMAVLSIFGIQATSLVAVMGAATLAIGMALQGTLSDLAAGLMLVVFRPYKQGEYVDVGGTSGTVKEITLFYTELTTPDNVQIIVPNGKAWGEIIRNYSHHKTRRLDLVFGIDYGDDANVAKEVITQIASAEARIYKDPEPWVRVTNLGDSSVDLTARLWCDNAEYWDLKFTLTQQIKEALEAKGISIPYPHRTIVQR